MKNLNAKYIWVAGLFVFLIAGALLRSHDLSIDVNNGSLLNYFQDKSIFDGYTPNTHEKYLVKIEKLKHNIKHKKDLEVLEFKKNGILYQVKTWDGFYSDEGRPYSAVGITIYPSELPVDRLFHDADLLKKIRSYKKVTVYLNDSKNREFASIICAKGKVSEINWSLEK